MKFIMSDTFSFMFLLFISLLFVHKKWFSFSLKIIYFGIILSFFCIYWFVGHSDWNKEFKLHEGLNNITPSTSLVYDSDVDAVKEIFQMDKPLRIKHLRSNKEPFYGGTLFSTEIVEINQKKYMVKLACYLTPLPWTPYETWEVHGIWKID